MASATIGLISFTEFGKIPEPDGFRLELRHGKLVKVAPPKQKHFLLQRAFRRRLEAAAESSGVVDTEIGFRATPDHEYRVADVAFVSHARWNAIPPEDNLQGAPDLVIEVLSPSNTAMEILDKEQLCLENGALEFWVVDPARSQVRVSTSDSRIQTYKPGEQITLFFGGTLSVQDIFFN